MDERTFKRDIFDILHILSSNDNLSQRELSKHLNLSLGKINYLLKSLIKKGLLEMKHFTVRDQKIKKIQYRLTKKGLKERINLTYHFLKEREAEYSYLKKQWKKLNVGVEQSYHEV